jgi:anion-transporting  ArsA/GET3 family ATPase
MPDIHSSHKLIIVTGKGGVGKTLLASALARLSASSGLNTVLVTLDTRDDRHPLLDVQLEYTPYQVAPMLAVSRVDAFEAVSEYARKTLPFSMFYEGFFKTDTFRDFATAAPGFEDLMCLGKLYNLAMQSEFDRVVFDAPATGHFRQLLEVPAVTARAVQVGPLNHNARKIQDLLLDADRTHVLVAALAEEMPVREALEIVDACRTLRMGVGPVLINRRIRPPVSDAEAASLALLLARKGELSAPAAAAIAASLEAAAISASQHSALEPLRQRRLRMLEIPQVVQPRFAVDELLSAVGSSLQTLMENGP